MDSPIFTLLDDMSDEALARLQGQINEASEAGDKHIVLAIDGLTTLDSARIRRLITLLRRTRETGADVALRVSRADLLRTLKVTALDKVFSLEISSMKGAAA